MVKTKPRIAHGILNKKYLWAIGVGCVVALAGVVYILLRANDVQDSARSADLSRLQTAILQYYGQHHQLPSSLRDVNAQLTGNVADYEYSFDKRQVGGPTTSFMLCASFHSAGLAPNRTSLAAGADSIEIPHDSSTYTYHRAGKQCFSYAEYKGQTHITYMLNPSEVIPYPTYTTDFSALVAATWSYYDSQAAKLGIKGSQSDLIKSCVERDKQTYSCSVMVRKSNAGAMDKSKGLAMLNDLTRLLATQGFSKPSVDEYGPLPGQPADAYSQDVTSYIDTGIGGAGCRIEAHFAPKWGLDYYITCNAKDANKIPDGFVKNQKNSPYQ